MYSRPLASRQAHEDRVPTVASIWTYLLSQSAMTKSGLSGLFLSGLSGPVDWARGGPLPTLHLVFLGLGVVGLRLEYYRRKQAQARKTASELGSAAG